MVFQRSKRAFASARSRAKSSGVVGHVFASDARATVQPARCGRRERGAVAGEALESHAVALYARRELLDLQ